MQSPKATTSMWIETKEEVRMTSNQIAGNILLWKSVCTSQSKHRLYHYIWPETTINYYFLYGIKRYYDLLYSNNGHSILVNVTRLLKLHRNHYLPRASDHSKGQPTWKFSSLWVNYFQRKVSGTMDKSDDLETVENVHRPSKRSINLSLKNTHHFSECLTTPQHEKQIGCLTLPCVLMD